MCRQDGGELDETVTMRVAVIGAGPCGLACARELARAGHDDWVVLEQASVAGGNAASTTDDEGFTWDRGGHVVFSQFGEFDALLSEVMGDELLEHDRSSYVSVAGRWIPYPFQNNLHHLPDAIARECLAGLLEAAPASDAGPDLGSWMESVFGSGITGHFMRPYNLKVWATALEDMSSNWIAGRVSVPNAERVLRNFSSKTDDRGWGPNSTFLFPRHGGTGEIYRRLATRLGERIRFGCEVVAIDPDQRLLTLASADTEPYDALVSTMPLDRLAAAIRGCPSDVRSAAQTLEHNSVTVVGVGYERPLQDDRSWLYFPDASTPFYRVTNFAKYAPDHVPGAETSRYCSYMTETAYRSEAPSRLDRIEQRVEAALVSSGVVPADSPVASIHAIDLTYAYPIPTLRRDRALATIQDWLPRRAIFSRGRFGAWRYEIGNMDHAVKMGTDVARLILEGRPEQLWPS